MTRVCPARWLGALALLIAGCSAPTQLVVIVDSDLEPVTELSTVVVAVSGGFASDSHTFDLSTVALPFSLGIAGTPDAPVAINTEGRGPSGVLLVLHRITTRFAAGQARRVDVPLARACTGERLCEGSPGEQTCVFGMCVPTAIEPGPRFDPSARPPRLFDGVSPPLDAGVMDDATMCVDGEECATDEPCERGVMACAGEPTCMVVGTLPEGTECGEGRLCSAAGVCGE